MPSLNKVILIGHLTADPELKQTAKNNSVVSFTIGVTRKHKAGEQSISDFMSCVAWNREAEFICKYFKKGNAICICGSIQTRSYDDNKNIKHYVTEVLVDDATFVEKKITNKASEESNFIEISNDEDIPF